MLLSGGEKPKYNTETHVISASILILEVSFLTFFLYFSEALISQPLLSRYAANVTLKCLS